MHQLKVCRSKMYKFGGETKKNNILISDKGKIYMSQKQATIIVFVQIGITEKIDNCTTLTLLGSLGDPGGGGFNPLRSV